MMVQVRLQQLVGDGAHAPDTIANAPKMTAATTARPNTGVSTPGIRSTAISHSAL